ncbi:MAG: carbohydrate binding family 9 domain-containing protein, partial [bacterium]|nr:carbohydrate binding family 9 domain-containing protein [bacterium]
MPVAALCLLPAVAAAGSDERPHHRVPKAAGPIDVDARLDESAWDQALRIELPYEVHPGRNSPAAVRTEMLVTWDDRHLYAGFRAWDPDPSTIRAHIADRDTVAEDDFVGITVDPFNDGRRGFEFFVNPLGVQMDLVNDDLTRTESFSWDAIWDSAGRLTGDGYVVEIAIPFSSLRFPRTAGEQTWGVDGTRIYPRGRRYRFRTQRFDHNLSCQICQISKMTGFAGVSPGRNLELNPTLTGGRTDARSALSDPELTKGEVDTDAGLTASWGITPNLALNATLNPDFSQVEADVAQLEVNTSFPLFFPETRPFFNEGADFFETAFNAVHTRVVTDPDWGIRLTGKQGRHALGFFSAQDTVTNLLLPGPLGSDVTSIDGDSVATVLRYRTDVGKRSNLGVLVTDREGEDYSNRLLGLDGVLRLTSSDA